MCVLSLKESSRNEIIHAHDRSCCDMAMFLHVRDTVLATAQSMNQNHRMVQAGRDPEDHLVPDALDLWLQSIRFMVRSRQH